MIICDHARILLPADRDLDITVVSEATAPTAKEGDERRVGVLEMLQELLQERRDRDVLSLVAKLVARNSELEQRLARAMSRTHKNEGVSEAQLKLFMDALTAESDDEAGADLALAEANQELRDASGIDKPAESEGNAARKRQPPLRQPPPAHLRRIDNPIAVPEQDRRCPRCGAERACMGHDVTEVIELVPAR